MAVLLLNSFEIAHSLIDSLLLAERAIPQWLATKQITDIDVTVVAYDLEILDWVEEEVEIEIDFCPGDHGANQGERFL